METFEDAHSEADQIIVDAHSEAEQIVDDDQIETLIDTLIETCPPSGVPGLPACPPVTDVPRPPVPVDFLALHAEAVQTTQTAVQNAIQDEIDQLRDLGARLKVEQGRLFDAIVEGIPAAVRDAASQGRRTAVLLRFDGADKFHEFCYLYMIKGPHKFDQRQEMRALGVKPLLSRLRGMLYTSGFAVHHAWQRATNENILSVSW